MKTTGILAALAGIWLALAPGVRADDDAIGGPNIGERLFLETRFAEFFFTNSDGNANAVLTDGDPVMNTTASIYGPLPGPFAGQSMNCRACHLVEEQESTGNRTYCDFAPRSPIPDIGDGRVTTPRNAMPLVNALLPRPTPLFLHFDGQFANPQDLIIATLTGRNYGWQPTEYATAIHHIANIIRDDDGSGGLAQQYGGWSYAITFAAYGEVEPQYVIPPENVMDVAETNTNSPDYVTDDEIVQNVASLIEQYLETLLFSQDTNGNFNGSPYDAFLAKNGLPQQPGYNEPPIQYSHHLLQLVTNLTNPQWVTDPADGHFLTNAHGQLFQFGSNELAGLEIFLTDQANLAVATNLQQQGITAGIEVGNCIACHTPPDFTDFLFHNNGAAQEEYDALHGADAFMALPVPGLETRQTNYNAYLPTTTNHPYATGNFETPPNTNNPEQADLGLWNVYANPDFPAPQAGLQQILPQLLSVPTPQISRMAASGKNFVFSGTNGAPGWTCYVLSSTNVWLPLGSWTVIATNTFDSEGLFSCTNATDPAVPQAFYALELGTLPPAVALPDMIARFKTPTVRDLVSSEPYLHTGQMDTIEDVIQFYINLSAQARAGTVRNADPQLSNVSLDNSAIVPLAAFLRSLDEEDYADIPCPCL
jgi:cytochrome c peroxidase